MPILAPGVNCIRPVMSTANVIQLRQMLSEKFPGLRQHLEEQPAFERFLPTGVPQLDEPLRGGLPQGALTEIVRKNAGSATLLRELIVRAVSNRQIVALIDGGDTLDVTQINDTALPRLLWIRCHSTDEILKAADLILRDGNLPMLLIDLLGIPEKQLRKIPPTSWYRLQRLIEETATVCAVFTPRPMVSPAEARITIHSHFALNSMESETTALIAGLEVRVSDARQSEQHQFDQAIA